MAATKWTRPPPPPCTAFAYELALRLVHDPAWRPPPDLSRRTAWCAVATAAPFSALELLLLRPALVTAAWAVPGLRDGLRRFFEDGGTLDLASWAALSWAFSAGFAIADVACVMRAAAGAVRPPPHLPNRAPPLPLPLVLRPAMALERRLTEVYANVAYGCYWVGESHVALAVAVAATAATRTALMVVLMPLLATLCRIELPHWKLSILAAMHVCWLTSMWAARGVTVVLVAALSPLRPTAIEG